MLAVASDRFPRTGAIAISIMGGIGMLSAGMIGSPGLGYAKDRFSTEALSQSNPAALQAYQAEKPSQFLFFSEAVALDGTKLAWLLDNVASLPMVLLLRAGEQHEEDDGVVIAE
jgi:hypothetical protein